MPDFIPQSDEPNMRKMGEFDGSHRILFPPHYVQDRDGSARLVMPSIGMRVGSAETDGFGEQPFVRIDALNTRVSLQYVCTPDELRTLALTMNEMAAKMEGAANQLLKDALAKRGDGA